MQDDVFLIAATRARIPRAPLNTHGVPVGPTRGIWVFGKDLIMGRPFVGCESLGSVRKTVGGRKIDRSVG